MKLSEIKEEEEEKTPSREAPGEEGKQYVKVRLNDNPKQKQQHTKKEEEQSKRRRQRK